MDQIHKRKRSNSSEPCEVQPHFEKKQRLLTPEFQSASSFWDNLSKVHLTHRALRELDSRNRIAEGSKQSFPRSNHRHQDIVILDPFTPRLDGNDLKEISRLGGLDLSDLRGFRNRPNSFNGNMPTGGSMRQQASSRRTEATSTSKKSSPYDRNFHQKLIDFGIYSDEYEYSNGRALPDPINLEALNLMLTKARSSSQDTSSMDQEFFQFKRTDKRATKEKQASNCFSQFIEDNTDTTCRAEDILFTHFQSLTDGTLTAGKPDIYYGARPDQLDDRVLVELDNLIVPSTQRDLPIVPNFFVEIKGPNGSIAVAEYQATYHAALGARAIHSLRHFNQDEKNYDNKARTISCIYHRGTLKIYACHMRAPSKSDSRPGYIMTLVNAYAMIGNAKSFQEGVTAFRNAREWAQMQRDEAIEIANSRASQLNSSSKRSQRTVRSTSSPSTDELAR